MSLDAPLKGQINIYEFTIDPRELYLIWELLYVPGVNSCIIQERDDVKKVVIRSHYYITTLAKLSAQYNGMKDFSKKEVLYAILGNFPLENSRPIYFDTNNTCFLIGVNFICYKGDNFVPLVELFGPDGTYTYTGVKKKKSLYTYYMIDCKKKYIDAPGKWKINLKFEGYKIPDSIKFGIYYSEIIK